MVHWFLSLKERPEMKKLGLIIRTIFGVVGLLLSLSLNANAAGKDQKATRISKTR
jgi:hypothetical protein